MPRFNLTAEEAERVGTRRGWLAACTLMGRMISGQSTVTEALRATRAAAPVVNNVRDRSYDWRGFLAESFPEYDTPEVVEAIEEWEQYRIQKKQDRWTETTWKRRITDWAKNWPYPRLRAALDHTIEHGWKGLYEPTSRPGFTHPLRKHDRESGRRVQEI